jgi:hypothetical protein
VGLMTCRQPSPTLIAVAQCHWLLVDQTTNKRRRDSFS